MVTDNKSFNRSNVLVTGAKGYIGSLLPSDWVSLDLNQNADLTCCISQFDKYIQQFEHIEFIIHLAECKLQEINNSNFNSLFSKQSLFLETIKSLPKLKKVLFASSCSVYGQSDSLINENSEVNPTSHYAELKLKIEEKLKTLDLPSQILRFGTAYGYNPKLTRKDLLINQISLAYKNSQQIEIFGADAWRPYIHCQDFSKALQTAIFHESIELYNIAQNNYTKRQILSFFDKYQNENRFYAINEASIDQRNYRIDTSSCEKLNLEFDWNLEKAIPILINKEF